MRAARHHGLAPWTTAVFAVVVTVTSLSALGENLKAVHAEDGLDYAIPGDSPVRFASLGRYGVGLFNGRFSVSGTYHYGYLSNSPEADSEYGVLDLYFVPDKKVAIRLPFWAQRRHVHEMRFKNDADFVKAIISPKAIRELKEKKIFSVSGRATVVVADYRISVECDYPTYSVSFIAAEQPGVLLASHAFVEQFGC